MTAAFEYEEPQSVDTATTPALADPADAAMAMVNYGPDVGEDAQEEASQEEGEQDALQDDNTVTNDPPEYTEEEYSELCRQATEDYELEVQRLENEYASASVERAKQQDTLKHMKNAEKELLEEIRELRLKGPDLPGKVKPRRAVTSLADNQEEASPLDVSSEQHEAYLSKSTRELLSGISGLGEKKLAALVERAPTVRDLEELRRQASEKNLGDFRQVLPKGIGEEMADKIEDALMKALAVSA